MAEAYRRGLVPPSLFGRTQHKTLHARLSEDIVARRDRSAFYRTAPGRFFLAVFLGDSSIPEEFRAPFPTRRRMREIVRGPSLALRRSDLASVTTGSRRLTPAKILGLLDAGRYSYEDPQVNRATEVFVRSFVCVRRQDDVLSYRLGRYREDRDPFLSRRSIGFSTLVHEREHTLFNMNDLGIVDSGVNAAKIDLDVPLFAHEFEGSDTYASLSHFLWVRQPHGVSDLLAVIFFRCPDHFEPLKRRLALNDLRWLNMRQPVNDVDDFDPWSKGFLLEHYESGGALGSNLGAG